MMSWDVISWEKEGTVDFVPSCWGNISRTVYRYPIKSGLTSSRLNNFKKKCVQLEDNFESLPAKCKRCNITDIDKALEYTLRYQDTSNIETEEEGMERRKRKHVGKKSSKLIMYESNTSSSSDEEHGHQKKKNFNVPNEDLKKSINTKLYNECKCVPAEKIKIISDCSLYPSGQNNNLLKTTTDTEASILNTSNSCTLTTDILTKILDELRDVKYELRCLKDSINTLGNRNLVGVQPEERHVGDGDVNLATLLPCNTLDEVNALESDIENNNVFNRLVYFLYLVGGDNLHKAVHLMMKKLLNSKVALLYSCQGRSSKKLKFMNLGIYRALFEAIRKKFPEGATEDVINKEIGLHLATAKSRLPPTEKKNVNDSLLEETL